MKLNAHALFFSLVVALLTAIICSSFILYAYYNRVVLHRHQQHSRLSENAISGINYLSALPEEFDQTIDLFGDGKDSVHLVKKRWGFFDVLFAKAFSNEKSKERVVMSGVSNNDQTALYLLDQNKKLSLTGRTKIVGDAYLPKTGVTRGYIGGNSYLGNQLIYGSTFTSTSTLPALNEEVVNHIIQLWNEQGEELQDSINHPFSQDTKYVNVDGVLSGFHKGNVVYTSSYPVLVSSICELNDVIVIAPSITIQRGFKGSAQFFAMDSLLVEENVLLNYPSVLGLIKKKTDHSVRPFIQIAKGSTVRGGLVAYQLDYDRSKTLIKVEKDVKIDGFIYTNGFLQHEGELNGKVNCASFYLSTKSSVYENYLKDAIIDRKALSEEFVWPIFLQKDISKSRKKLKRIDDQKT